MRSLAVRRLLSLVVGSSVVLLASCSQDTPAPPPPPAVEVMTVAARPIPNIVEIPGRVQAVRTSEVRARVNGIVQRRLYEEGSDVRAGQALFAIDPRELRASLNAVEAALARAQANAANAQQDVNRYQGLIADQAISKQEYDAAVARLRTAQADVAQARAQVDSARLSLGYTTVTAPISGRAGRAQVTEGALVSATEGTLLTTIEQMNPIYVNFSQSSASLLEVRRDMMSGNLKMPALDRIPVRLTLEDGSTYGAAGHIDFLDLSIDPATGTAAIRAEFPNPGRILVPGQFVRAIVEAGVRPDGVVLPQRAVRLNQQRGSVMVVGPKNIVEERSIELGELQASEWTVLAGLKPGERVIVNGLQRAMPGQPVRIVSAAKAPAGAPVAKSQPASAAR